MSLHGRQRQFALQIPGNVGIRQVSTPSSRTPVAGIGESELHSEAEIYPL
jgi:hypothetical protein